MARSKPVGPPQRQEQNNLQLEPQQQQHQVHQQQQLCRHKHRPTLHLLLLTLLSCILSEKSAITRVGASGVVGSSSSMAGRIPSFQSTITRNYAPSRGFRSGNAAFTTPPSSTSTTIVRHARKQQHSASFVNPSFLQHDSLGKSRRRSLISRAKSTLRPTLFFVTETTTDSTTTNKSNHQSKNSNTITNTNTNTATQIKARSKMNQDQHKHHLAPRFYFVADFEEDDTNAADTDSADTNAAAIDDEGFEPEEEVVLTIPKPLLKTKLTNSIQEQKKSIMEEEEDFNLEQESKNSKSAFCFDEEKVLRQHSNNSGSDATPSVDSSISTVDTVPIDFVKQDNDTLEQATVVTEDHLTKDSTTSDAAASEEDFFFQDGSTTITNSQTELSKDTFQEDPPAASEIQKNAIQDPADLATILQGLQSKPIPGGNWDPFNPLDWTRDFGTRSLAKTQEYERLAVSGLTEDASTSNSNSNSNSNSTLLDADSDKQQHHKNQNKKSLNLEHVVLIQTHTQAQTALHSLLSSPPSTYHACDTEVMQIDLKTQGPIGNGYVTCATIYSGPDFDCGIQGANKGSVLWIDNLDASKGILQVFKPFFESQKHKKVWHNYGFDRHVLFNEGINVQGLGGDTMHMARLQDTSRAKYGSGQGYSLEALTEDFLKRRKRPMKELFGIRRPRKDGTLGLVVDVPPIEVLQRDARFREMFILYAAYDAEGTWYLRQALEQKLKDMPWTTDDDDGDGKKKTMYDYYQLYLREFAEVLTDMERRGMRVDAKDYLAKVEIQARKDRAHHLHQFRQWAERIVGLDGAAMNPASSVQIATFLFGGALNGKTKQRTEEVRTFAVPREEVPEEVVLALEERERERVKAEEEDLVATTGARKKDELDKMTAAQLKLLCKDAGLKLSGKKAELQERLRGHYLAACAVSPAFMPGTPSANMASETSMDTDKMMMMTEPPPDLDTMTVAQLKVLLRKYSLKVSGRKAVLQERLREYFATTTTTTSMIPTTHNQDEFTLANPNTNNPTMDDFDSMSHSDLRDACIARGLPSQGTPASLKNALKEDAAFALEVLAATAPSSQEGYRTVSEALEAAVQREGGNGTLTEILNMIRGKEGLGGGGGGGVEGKKTVNVTIRSIGMTPEKYTSGGAPSVTADVIKSLAGEPLGENPKYGKAYEFFGGGKAGHDACVGLYSLTAIGSIDTMIANFLTSLQSLADSQSRVHCSLNFNTETGRLSSRRPNLQNQPALEKDKYQIRKAFQASPGNHLIVADYGQLELRLLASMTNCTSMIDAFKQGGDFHSRTAMGMFSHIQEKVDKGEILFEWDYSKGDPPKPLVKDEYASERRKAKTLNFSIAYGKTAHGLSKDWGVSVQEADEMLKAWYNSRPEVLQWQKAVKQYARKHGVTRTLMGRYRKLPDAMQGGNRRRLGHSERASINTPIQGGAADIAMMAMIKMNKSPLLKRLGWVLLMQIHDEVILEGPKETAKEAFDEVIKCMEEPWVFGLEKTAVPLSVDGSYVHTNWYDAK